MTSDDTSTDSSIMTSDVDVNMPLKNDPRTSLNGYNAHNIADAQSADPVTGLVISWLIKDYVPPKDELLIYDQQVRSLMSGRSSLCTIEDKLGRLNSRAGVRSMFWFYQNLYVMTCFTSYT